MIARLFDENFNHRIVRGLERRSPDLDGVTVQSVGFGGMSDPDLLEWAANNNRVLVTHDVNTVVDFADERIRRGVGCAGVVIVPRQMRVGQAIEEIDLLNECVEQSEMLNRILYLPL